MGSELAKTPAVASKQPVRKPLNALRERTVIVVPPSNFTPINARRRYGRRVAAAGE
jgi:hypothetical protein